MKGKCATDEFCTKVALAEVESDAFGFLSSVFGKSYASCAFNRFTRKVEKMHVVSCRLGNSETRVSLLDTYSKNADVS